MQACDRCHARKTRCDRRIPQCSACEKAGTPCLHADKLRQRNIPRGYIDGIEKLVQDLTNENAKLRVQLDELATQQKNAQAAHAQDAANVGQQRSGSHIPESISSRSPASSSRHSGMDNVYAVEVGYLSLVATGETRYLGSGSGMSLANLISSAICPQSDAPLPEPLGAEMDSLISTPPGAQASSQTQSEPHVPLVTDAKPLIDAYFQHTHITFPLLHRPSFMASVKKIYDEPGYYEANVFEAFVFDMVLAIGSSNFNRLDEPTTSASSHYAAAQTKVPRVMAMDGLTILRAILLISQHGIFSNLKDTSASIWHLVGIGARLCFEQGLHLDQGQLNGRGPDLEYSTSSVTLEEEMKRRCFWCLYNLDRVVGFTLGRPLAIRDDEIDVPLPSPLSDEEIDAHNMTLTPSNPNDSPRLSPFLHLIRIRKLSGQILSTFYNSRHTHNTSLEEKKTVRQQFRHDIIAWRDDTKLLNLQKRGPGESSYLSCFLTEEWYEAVYNNALLLLYRPSPYLPHVDMEQSTDIEQPEVMVLLEAAKASIESYSTLRQKRRLNYSWITLHGVFLAGIAYVYGTGRLLREPTYRALAPDILSIIEVTRGCSNVLVAICERWNVSRRSCDLFNKLSNAIITDSLNATKMGQNDKQYTHMGSTFNMPPAGDPSAKTFSSSNQRDIANGGGSVLDETALGDMPQLGDFLVMDTFRHYASTFDLAHQRETSLPSELISGFSQDWSFDIPFTDQDQFDTSM